ncbi:unnamed protein product [Gadus morhua 'NCC']
MEEEEEEELEEEEEELEEVEVEEEEVVVEEEVFTVSHPANEFPLQRVHSGPQPLWSHSSTLKSPCMGAFRPAEFL